MAFAPFPAATYLADGARTEGEMKSAFENWLLATKQTGGHGECRLVYTSATVLTLLPWNGRRVLVANQAFLMPVSGFTITNAGLSANAGYYVCLYDAALDGAAVPALLLVGGGVDRAPDPDSGVEMIRFAGSFDPRYTVVGLVGTNASSQFEESFVCSLFNRELAVTVHNLAAEFDVTTPTPVTAVGARGIGWKGERINVQGLLSVYRGAAGNVTLGATLTGTGVGSQSPITEVAGFAWHALPVHGRMVLAADQFWDTLLQAASLTSVSLTIKPPTSIVVTRMA